MTAYRVTWEIDVDADSPHEAARIAQAMQQTSRPNYWCGAFTVKSEAGDVVAVDLDDGYHVATPPPHRS